MDLSEAICRICLDTKIRINWNAEIEAFCGISYKTCYYKYTQLEEPDADRCYPAYLCDRCASELKNAHMFFEHALESFKILQNTFKTKELNAENLLKNSYNSEGIVCEAFDHNFTNEKEHYDIDEVICYSPVNDDADTENGLSELVYEEDSESPLEISTEEQPTDSSYIKILNSLLKNKDSYTRKYGQPIETTLELNLELEIHGSNLLKSTVKKSTKHLSQSLHQSLIKTKSKKHSKNSVPHQAVHCNITFERVQNSNHQLPDSVIHYNNTESLETDVSNALEKQTNAPYNPSLLEETPTNISTNDTVPSKANELLKSSVAKSSGSKRGSELAEYLWFMRNFNRDDINSLAASPAHLNLKKLPKHECNKKPSEQSLIPFLEERFGKDTDENILRACKPKKQKDIMCQYCSKVFISVYKAIEHEKTHLENRERKETCTKCGLKFYNKNALRSHMYTHKENREKNLKCEFCGKAFYNNNGLSIHRKIHVGPRIPCSICSKEYYRQSDLDKHMVSHSVTRVDGDLKYKKKYFVYCEICGKEVRSVDYKSHIAKHNNQPLAKCAICNKEFFSRKSCISHIKSVHRKGSGERSNFAISYKTKYYSKLFLEQKTGTLFTKDKV